MLKRIVRLKGSKVTHALMGERDTITACGVKVPWGTSPSDRDNDELMCKHCIRVTCERCRDILCTLKQPNPTKVRADNSQLSEALRNVVVTLKLAHGMSQTCTAGAVVAKEYYLKKIRRNSWGHRDEELWKYIEGELGGLVQPYDDWKRHLFKYTPELAGLIAALLEVPPGKEQISEAEVIMLESLALTKGIKLKCHLRSILVEDGKDLIEWLRTVVIVTE